MTLLLRAGCALLAFVSLVAFAPAIARAQTEVALIGTFTDTDSSLSGPAGGAFSLTSFANQEQTLVATGSAHIGFCVPNVDPKNCLANITVTVTMPVTDVSGSCDGIIVTLGAIETVVVGRFVFDLQVASPLVLTGGSTGLRCAIARRAASNEPLFTLAPSLNLLLR